MSGTSEQRTVRRWVAPTAYTVLIGGAVLALWAFVLEPASLWTPETTVHLPDFPEAGLRIAVLTDLHVGSPFHGVGKLEEIVRRTMAETPDLVVILGDLVIHGVLGGRFVEPEEIADRLGELSAPLGVYAVLGNHDHWLDATRVTAALETNGIGVLEDLAVELPTDRRGSLGDSSADPVGRAVWLAGVSDYWEGAHDITGALSSVPEGASTVLITHNPDIFPDVPPGVALTIAGHTHGGQVRIPLVGTPIVPSDYGSRFVSGHIVEEGRHLFVATGTGTSMLPVRFRVPPRVRILNLAPETPPA